MKILIAINHPAQYHLFKNSYRDLKTKGHEVIIVIKDKDILEKLLISDKVHYVKISRKHVGKNRFFIIINGIFDLVVKDFLLFFFILKYRPNLLVGSDFSITHVGKILGIPSVVFNEDDFDINRAFCSLAYPFSSCIVSPNVCNVGKYQSKKIGYDGYQKLAYLHPDVFQPDISIVKKYFQIENNYFIIRLVSFSAVHDAEIKHGGLESTILFDIIEILRPYGNVYLTSESNLPESLNKYKLDIDYKDIHHILAYATLIIADSQSMIVEAAMLGTPSIRFNSFVGKISVLKELENKYELTIGIHNSRPDLLISKIKELLGMDDLKKIYLARKEKMLEDKINVNSFITWFIENYPLSEKALRKNPDYKYSSKAGKIRIVPFRYIAGKICSCCIMDDTVKGIKFDEEGKCSFCQIHERMIIKYPINNESTQKLQSIINKIKQKGKNRKYDCIVGVSGGRDSTFALYNAVKFGLRPLAVHFDNGWNSEIAVQNIKNATKKLGIDLYTHVADWEEFKNLQKAFLKASVPDAEVPTDWVIFSVLFKIAAKENIRFVIHGHSFLTEGTTPLTWTYMDGRYVKHIHRKFGTGKTRSFPVMSLMGYLYYTLVKRIRHERILYYLKYEEKEVMDTITKELDWKDYGGKHHESKYTAFYQSYILTRKFGIDKRKLHYSALIRSNQLSREQALLKVYTDPYIGGEELLDYCLKKLDLTYEEFELIMNDSPKSFMDYKSFYSFVKFMKRPVKWATELGIVPETVYLKYFHF